MNKFNIALFQPRIPQNTGNIARTCAAFKIKLELIKPLGFSLEDKYLKRAGLDYWEYVDVQIHESYSQFKNHKKTRLIAFSKFSSIPLFKFRFEFGDTLLFGREDNGLPEEVKKDCFEILNIPMPGGSLNNTDKLGVRSLNLSVSCGIAAYQAYRDIYNC